MSFVNQDEIIFSLRMILKDICIYLLILISFIYLTFYVMPTKNNVFFMIGDFIINKSGFLQTDLLLWEYQLLQCVIFDALLVP
jgi:hypothetical protein